MMTVADGCQKLIFTLSFSKTFNLPGIRKN